LPINMPKTIYFMVICLAFLGQAGCDSATKSQLYPDNQLPAAPRRQLTGSQEKKNFLALFAPQDTFPLKVSTKVGEWEGPQSEKFLWKGRPLPEKYWFLFDSLLQVKHNFSGETFYANKRFRVSGRTQALLTRVPGQYWSSQIYLLLLDTVSFRVTRAYRLAESWGDAGDSFYLESVIHQTRPGEFRLESQQGECHPLDADYRRFKCTDTLTVGLLQENQIKIISRKPMRKKGMSGKF
jgi:hypothetical protein